MSKKIDTKAVFSVADKFIALANDLAPQDEDGNVGMGIRYAAARYNTFEASKMTDDLARDKQKMLDLFVEDFRKMMAENLDDYVRHLAEQKGQH